MTKLDGLVRVTKPWLNRHGWDVARFPGRAYGHRRALLMSRSACDVVLDIGANVGQFAEEIRFFGYHGMIYSFEPTREAYAQLQRKASGDPLWFTVPTALGDEPGKLTMHISENSVSSSPLPMLGRHSEVEPSSTYVRDEVAPVTTLDVLVRDEGIQSRDLWLKIDTQGYEQSVLAGAQGMLSRCAAIEMELSLTPLYEGQMLLTETIDKMQSLGFRLAALESQFWDKGSGETLQADGIFVRLAHK